MLCYNASNFFYLLKIQTENNNKYYYERGRVTTVGRCDRVGFHLLVRFDDFAGGRRNLCKASRIEYRQQVAYTVATGRHQIHQTAET